MDLPAVRPWPGHSPSLILSVSLPIAINSNVCGERLLCRKSVAYLTSSRPLGHAPSIPVTLVLLPLLPSVQCRNVCLPASLHALASLCVSVPLKLALFFTHSRATLILAAFLLSNPTSPPLLRHTPVTSDIVLVCQSVPYSIVSSLRSEALTD